MAKEEKLKARIATSGFYQAVVSEAKSVMTSGQHYHLTNWIDTKKGMGSNPLFILAANEVLLPEGERIMTSADLEVILKHDEGFFEEGVKALKKGSGSRKEYIYPTSDAVLKSLKPYIDTDTMAKMVRGCGSLLTPGRSPYNIKEYEEARGANWGGIREGDLSKHLRELAKKVKDQGFDFSSENPLIISGMQLETPDKFDTTGMYREGVFPFKIGLSDNFSLRNDERFIGKSREDEIKTDWNTGQVIGRIMGPVETAYKKILFGGKKRLLRADHGGLGWISYNISLDADLGGKEVTQRRFVKCSEDLEPGAKHSSYGDVERIVIVKGEGKQQGKKKWKEITK